MEFKNATVIKKANIYFDGKVSSRTVITADGTRYTLGLMQAGDYDFPTEAAEVMEVLGGSGEVQLAGETGYKTYGPGTSFDVPANSSYKITIPEYLDYCCYYKD